MREIGAYTVTMDERRSSSADHDGPSLGPRIHISDNGDQAESAVEVSTDCANGVDPLPASANDNTTSHLHIPLDVKGFFVYQLEFIAVSLSSVSFQNLL